MNEIDTSTTDGKIAILTAFKEGKTIQYRSHPNYKGYPTDWDDVDSSCLWQWNGWEYRIKPLEFPKLPEGMEWQIAEEDQSLITPDFIGAGYRPSVKGEILPKGAQFWSRNRNGWHGSGYIGVESPLQYTVRVPLSTPFPEPPKPKVMVPLTAEDATVDSWLKSPFTDDPTYRPTCVDSNYVYLQDASSFKKSFNDLMEEGWKISRDGGRTWKPCEKESAS